MGPKRLQGSCDICETIANMKYRSVTELGLNKAYTNKTNIPSLKLGDILCHNCYMKIVECDQNEKKKTKIIKKQSNYDFTYQLPNQNCVTISQKNYESLSEKAKRAEELQKHIDQLEAALE